MRSLKVLTMAVNDQSQAECKSRESVEVEVEVEVEVGGTMGAPHRSPGGLDGACAKGVEGWGGVWWYTGVGGGAESRKGENTICAWNPGLEVWRRDQEEEESGIPWSEAGSG